MWTWRHDKRLPCVEVKECTESSRLRASCCDLAMENLYLGRSEAAKDVFSGEEFVSQRVCEVY